MKQLSTESIPGKGYCLLSFRNALVFEPYECRDGLLFFNGRDRLEWEQPYECRFFDRDRDCHMVFREARGDFCERIYTQEEEKSMDPDLLYTEKVLLREEYAGLAGYPSRLVIVNRYRYSQSDTLILKNYRISYE